MIQSTVTKKRSAPSELFEHPDSLQRETQSAIRYVWPIFFAIIVCLGAARTVLRPAYNWDMVAYLGCIHALDHADPATIHEQTFAELRRTVPDEVFQSLTAGNGYYETMASDPSAFHQQLPFYRVKPLYVGLLYAMKKLGMGGHAAMTTISIVSYLLIASLCYFWIQKYVGGFFGTVFAGLTAISPPLLQTAALSTPDLLSASLLLVGTYQLLERNRVGWSLVPFTLALLVRPDSVLFLVILFGGLRLLGGSPIRLKDWQYVAIAGSAVAVYGLCGLVMKGYPFRTLFEHTFKGLIEYPAGYVSTLTIADYLRALLKACDAIPRSHLVLYVGPALVCVWLQRRFQVWKNGSIYLSFLYLVIGSMFLRLLIHPAVFDRFLVFHFLTLELIAIVFLSQLARRFPRSDNFADSFVVT